MRHFHIILLTVGTFSGFTTLEACGGDSQPQDGNAPVDAAVDAPLGTSALRQVIMTERLEIDGISQIIDGRLAFGQHDGEFFSFDDSNVESAIANHRQEIRIVFDGPLRRSRFEEIGCADGTYSRYPDDTTPEDIAICGGLRDSLDNCTKVCLDPDGGDTPIGILDNDRDGVADARRLVDFDPDPSIVELAISITCDGTPVPLSQPTSHWQEEGSQTLPQGNSGYKQLGPALVLEPRGDVGFRTSATCQMTFHEDVVDFHGTQVCASANGLASETCTPGDTSSITFSTEPLFVVSSRPGEGEIDVSLDPSYIRVQFSGVVDPDTQDIILTADGVVVPAVLQFNDDQTTGFVQLDADFLPSTVYELTIGPGIRDMLGGEVVESSFSFTTAGS
jgi:hypothetical protein